MLRSSTLACGLLALTLVLNTSTRLVSGQESTKGHTTAPATETHLPAHAGDAIPEQEKADITKVEPSLAIYTVIVFGLLLAILGRFAWRPLIKSMHEREAHFAQVLLDSERARNEAEAIAASHRKQLAGAADEVRALIEQARREAQISADSILKKAHAEVEASRDRAEKDITGARDQALMEIWSKTADLAVAVAGRVLDKELGDADHRRLVEAALNELPTNGRDRGPA